MTIKKKYSVLIVDDDSNVITLAIIRSLGLLKEYRLNVLSLNENKYPLYRFSRYLNSYICQKTSSDEDIFKIIKETSLKLNANILIPVTEKTIRILAERYKECKKFVLIQPIPDPIILELVRNKWKLYNWLYDRRLITTKPFLLSEFLSNNEYVKNQFFPLLLKPVWGSGGKGIVFIENLSELKNLKMEKLLWNHEYLIQPYIRGFDIDISLLSIEGTITAYIIQKGFAKNKEFEYSRAIEFINDNTLYNLTKRIIKELNYSGIAHLDFRYDVINNKYILIDFNARYWSTMLGALRSGINFPKIISERILNMYSAIPEYKECKYYSTNNLFKLVYSHIPIKNSDFWFNLKDPMPFLNETIRQFNCLFKKFILGKKANSSVNNININCFLTN